MVVPPGIRAVAPGSIAAWAGTEVGAISMTVCCGDPNTDPFPMNWVGVEPIAVMANGRKWEEMGAFGTMHSHTSAGQKPT